MGQSVQNDVKEGARTRWLATTGLVARIPAASLFSGSVKPGTAPPYATLRCEFVRRDEFMPATAGQRYVAVERLIVSVWAIGSDGLTAEDQVGDLTGLVQGAFANEAWTVPDSTLIAVYPEQEVNTEEDGTYRGEAVWRAEVGFELWLERVKPAAA